MVNTVRPAAVAGRFYPAHPSVLRREVERCRQEAVTGPDAGAPKILLAPHAGTVYSGPVAASAYATLAPWRDRIRRVVLLGPAHRIALRGLAAPTASRFATPLGEVAIDHEALRRIDRLPQVVVSDLAHADEHSVEVQLPFLQLALGDFTLVPLVVGRATAEDVLEVIETLWGGDETLIVVSSDLSHYLPYDEAQRRDAATVAAVLALDPDIEHDEACGATPLAGALLAARRHGLAARLLDLRNSGDTAGDRRHVVGYAAVAFEAAGAGAPRDDDETDAARSRPRPDETDDVDGDDDSDDEAAGARRGDRGSAPRGDERLLGQALLARARNAIAEALGHATAPEPAHRALDVAGATFVTLRCRGELRGCIGTLRAERRLHDDVRQHALAAAFEDPRFPPLARHEYAELEIEVSLLGEAEALVVAGEAHALRQLRPGRDGVILEWRGHRATFLPQVWEQLPQPAAFMAALKRKAGLGADFWADDLRLARYEVRKFVEAGVRPEAPRAA